MLNFISISIFKRFFNENLNCINNSFKINYCSFKKMADNGKIFAEYSQKTARPGPARPSPLKFARPDLSSLGFTTLLDSSNFKLYSRVKISKLSEMKFLILKKINYKLKIFRKIRKKLLKNINQNFRNFSRKLLSTIFVEITFR